MKTKALRLPDDLMVAVKYAEKKEKLDEPTLLRKFLRMGTERYVAECYSRGEVSLREAAAVLDRSPRETMDLLWDMGVSGNVDADLVIKSIATAKEGATKTSADRAAGAMKGEKTKAGT